MIRKFENFLDNFNATYADIIPEEGDPKSADYVICEIIFGDTGYANDKLQDFLTNNVGQIVAVKDNYTHNYYVKYDVLPKKLKRHIQPGYTDNIITFRKRSIKYFSEDKEYLEAILATKKYNI